MNLHSSDENGYLNDLTSGKHSKLDNFQRQDVKNEDVSDIKALRLKRDIIHENNFNTDWRKDILDLQKDNKLSNLKDYLENTLF